MNPTASAVGGCQGTKQKSPSPACTPRPRPPFAAGFLRRRANARHGTDAVRRGIVHEPTQTAGRGLDLTVAEIHRITGPGRVDFGGGEREAADRESIDTERRNPDDYGWWDLDAGRHLLSHDESLSAPDDLSLGLQPHEAMLARGAAHPTLHVRSLETVPPSVGGAGLRPKENARVSTLLAPGTDGYCRTYSIESQSSRPSYSLGCGELFQGTAHKFAGCLRGIGVAEPRTSDGEIPAF